MISIGQILFLNLIFSIIINYLINLIEEKIMAGYSKITGLKQKVKQLRLFSN